MIRIEHYIYTRHKAFIRQVYENSFPKEERFDFSILKSCDKERNVHLSCILSDDVPTGMQFTVDLPNDITYLMYFAIDEQYRNNGMGSRALKNLVIAKDNILLCIEKPIDVIELSRKNFYLRNGFYETNVSIEDSGIQYELLSTVKGYAPTETDLKNRYKFMTSKRHIWKKIMRSFDTEFIKLIH